MKKKLLLISAFALLGGVNVMADEPDYSSWTATDVTETYIGNYNLSDAANYSNNSWCSTWTVHPRVSNNTGKETNGGHLIYSTDSGQKTFQVEQFNITWNTAPLEFSQTIESLPAGVYRLSSNALVRLQQSATPTYKETNDIVYLAAGDTKAYVDNVTDASLDFASATSSLRDGGHAVSLVFTLDAAASVKVGFFENYEWNSNDGANYWFVGTILKLEKLTDPNAEADPWETLKNKVSTAEAAYNSYDTGKMDAIKVFYYNAQTQYDALDTAIANAKAAYAGTYDETTDNAQQAALQTAIENLNAVQPTKPDATKWYNIAQWTWDLNMSWSEGDNQYLVCSDHATLPYAVQFVEVSGADNQYKIKNAKDEYLQNTSTWNLTPTTSEWATTFVFVPTTSGIQIKPNGSNYMIRYPSGMTVGSAVFVGNQNYYNFTVTEATGTSVTMRISAAKWGTFVAPFDVTIPADVKAFTVEYVDGSLNTTAVEGTILANTPVLIYKDVTEAWSQTFSGYAQSYYTGWPKWGSLVGTLGAYTLPSDGTAYLLQKNGEDVGFYQLTKENITSTANRAYLYIPTEAPVKFFSLSDAITTGVCTLSSTATEAPTEVYTLAGTRTSELHRGLNIVRTADGSTRKVIVK